MPSDLFQKLSQVAVPPPPAELDRAVHERVNRVLVTAHIFDFAVHAAPYAAWHLARAIGGLIALTFTGRFPPGPKDAR